MIRTRLLNSLGLLTDKLSSILEGERGNMDTVVYWDIFESTGSIEAYLAYCKTEEVSSGSSAKSEELKKKGFEGEE